MNAVSGIPSSFSLGLDLGVSPSMASWPSWAASVHVDWLAFAVSLRLACVVSVGLLIFVLPLAFWYSFSESRWRPWLDAAMTVPIAFPPTVLGFYLLLLLAPMHMAFTFTALSIGAFVINLPIAMQAFQVAVTAVPRSLLEASWCLGWSKSRTFFWVVVPLAWRGLLAGVILCFAHTFGEFGVAVMVGGNISGVTRTTSIAIYDQAQNLDLRAAHQTALLQVLISFCLLALISFLKLGRGANGLRRR